MSAQDLLTRLRASIFAVLDHEGSTRAFGLLRIVAVFVITQRVTYSWAPHQLDMTPTETLWSVVFWLSAWCALFGYRTRASLVVMSAAYTAIHIYYGKVLGHGSLGHPAQPLQVIWLLVFTPCERSFSVDRYLAVRRARAGGHAPPEEVGPLWMRAGFILHLTAIYFWAVYDKSDAMWFTGARLERIWMSHYGSSDDFALYGGLLHGLSVLGAWGTYALEVMLTIGLFIPRLYRFLIPTAFVLHMAFWLVLGVGPFTSMMLAAYLGVIDPAWVHRFVETLTGSASASASALRADAEE